MPIERATLFSVTDADKMQPLIEGYATMKQDAKKDGKSYILDLKAGRTVNDPRSKGITYAVFATYASEEDMKYYDDEDPAHGKLKSMLKGILSGPPTVVYFTDETKQ